MWGNILTHIGVHHNKKQEEPMPPYPPLALSCTSIASFAIAPTHGAAAPHESVLGAVRWVRVPCG
jgi:hypothetical protein